MKESKPKTVSPNYNQLVDFNNSEEIGRLINNIQKGNIDKKELEKLAVNLIYRIAFYFKNRTVNDLSNISREEILSDKTRGISTEQYKSTG